MQVGSSIIISATGVAMKGEGSRFPWARSGSTIFPARGGKVGPLYHPFHRGLHWGSHFRDLELIMLRKGVGLQGKCVSTALISESSNRHPPWLSYG